ncbi:putative ABC sugar transporter [Lachnospiraceae bacterium KM106-2]|nr:putative ABC sugar transporter [Lachnospiraceae bacterium KM106-2]
MIVESQTGVKKKPFNLLKWIKSGKGQRVLVIITFMIIPLTLLFLFTYFPFVEMFKFSFYKMKYIGDRQYVGMKNYVDVFRRDDCFKALWLSLYYIGAAFIQLSVALYFASILSTRMRGGNFFKGFIFFPYLICGIAVGFIFKFFYTRGFVLDTVLSWIGFDLNHLPYWLKDTSINNFSLAATSIWRYLGQNMVLFIGAIMSVDSSMYEAAAIDGASGFSKFRYITLPNIKKILVLNIILSITGSLSAFEPPYVITGGEFGTGTYFVIMNKIAHTSQKVGLASAMAIVLFGIIVLATVLQKVIMNKLFGKDDEFEEAKMIRKQRKLFKKQQKGAAL